MKRLWRLAPVLFALACGSGNSNPVIIIIATPTATVAATATATAAPAKNGPPVLGMFVVPSPPAGAAPFDLLANMCRCSDPDADHLFFTLKWGDGTLNFRDSGCRFEHVYVAAGTYRAIFCVSDHINPDVCNDYLVKVS